MCDSDAKFGGKDGAKTPPRIFEIRAKHDTPFPTQPRTHAGLAPDPPPIPKRYKPDQTLLQNQLSGKPHNRAPIPFSLAAARQSF